MPIWYQWLAAGQPGRNYAQCSTCRFLHETVWAVGNGPASPLHLHCRCETRVLGSGLLPPVAWDDLPLLSQWMYAGLYGQSEPALTAAFLVSLGLMWRHYGAERWMDEDVPPPPEGDD